jgi:hypothetical protein
LIKTISQNYVDSKLIKQKDKAAADSNNKGIKPILKIKPMAATPLKRRIHKPG